MPTINVNRSDQYPPGTVVAIYPRSAVKRSNSGQKPSGTALSSGTVDAAGKLTLTVPAKTAWAAWAEVAGEHRVVEGGDPTPDHLNGTLQERQRNRRALVGAGA